MINNHQVSRKKSKESDPHHAKDTRSIRVISGKNSIKRAFFTVKEDCTLTLPSLPQDIERRFESHEQSQ
jgi:hypothetical protein